MLVHRYLHVFIGGMPDTEVNGGRDMGGIPGMFIFDMGGKLGNPGIGAAPGAPVTIETT